MKKEQSPEYAVKHVKTDKGIESITVRFFILDVNQECDDSEWDIQEVAESEFINFEGKIDYERHSIFENGCRQICLTKSNTES